MRCCGKRRSCRRRGGRKRDERNIVERKTPPAAKPPPGRNFGGGVFKADEAFADGIGAGDRRTAADEIDEIVLGKRAITADTDLRLARYFGMSEGFFIGLQTDFELMERKRAIGDKLEAIRPRAAA